MEEEIIGGSMKLQPKEKKGFHETKNPDNFKDPLKRFWALTNA